MEACSNMAEKDHLESFSVNLDWFHQLKCLVTGK